MDKDKFKVGDLAIINYNTLRSNNRCVHCDMDATDIMLEQVGQVVIIKHVIQSKGRNAMLYNIEGYGFNYCEHMLLVLDEDPYVE